MIIKNLKSFDDYNISLIKSFFDKNISSQQSRKNLNWQYSNSESYLCVDHDEKNKVICTNGFLKYDLFFKKEKLKCCKSESSFVVNKYRGTLVFNQLFNNGLNFLKEKKFDFCFGFTHLPEIWNKFFNFTIHKNCIKETTFIIRPLTVFKLKDKIFMKYIYYSLLRLMQKKILEKYVLEIKYKINENELNKIISLHNRVVPEKYVKVVLDKEFFDWRINQNPNLQYETLFFYYEKKIIGYCFLNTSNFKNFYITDLFFSDIIYLSSIMHNIFKIARNKNALKISFWGNYENVLIKQIHDFISLNGGKTIVDKNMAFVVKDINKTLSDLDIENYFINGLWTQGFRI